MKRQHSVLLVFLILTQVVIGQSKWPDKAVCTGNEVELGDAGDSKLCYSWKAIPEDPAVLRLSDPKIKIKPTQTSVYTRTTIGSDFSSRKTDEVKVFVVKDIKLKEVSFSENEDIEMDDGSGVFTAPHWKEGAAKQAPVCYKAGSKMKLSAKIELDQNIGSGITIKVRAKGTGGNDLPSKSIVSAGKNVNFPATEASKNFPSQVDFMDPLEIQWEISFDDEKTWCPAGTSKNPLYVLWKAPVGGVKLFYTVVHLGCKNAKGQSSESNIFSGIWNDFKDRDVKRADGLRMTYYGDWETTNVGTPPLLKFGDGQCSTWASLLLDILKAQGIQESNPYVFVYYIDYRKDYGFLVKNWTFNGTGKSGDPIYPYINILGSPFISSNTYNWAYADVTDAVGIPGQGNPNPTSFFGNHQFVKYKGRYYDPSYGTEGGSIADMEANSIDAFLKIEPNRLVSEAVLGVDLNGDGDKNDIGRVPFAFILKKNPATQDLTEVLGPQPK